MSLKVKSKVNLKNVWKKKIIDAKKNTSRNDEWKCWRLISSDALYFSIRNMDIET